MDRSLSQYKKIINRRALQSSYYKSKLERINQEVREGKMNENHDGCVDLLEDLVEFQESALKFQIQKSKQEKDFK